MELFVLKPQKDGKVPKSSQNATEYRPKPANKKEAGLMSVLRGLLGESSQLVSG